MSNKISDNSDENIKKDFSDLLDTFDKENKEKSFEALLESYGSEVNDDIQVGDKIRGEIIHIGRDTVFINTGSKIDGAVEKMELLDENGDFPYQNDDYLELYVVSISESEIILSKALSGIGGLNQLMDAYQNKIPVEGKVLDQCKGGFNVEVMLRRAFCPISQMDLKYVENPDEYTGKTYKFFITLFEENGRNIVVSRRKFLDKDLEEERNKFLSDLKVGSQMQGTVTNLKEYGVFIELFPGIEGMAHISELSWSRVKHPNEILKRNDTVDVIVLNLEKVEGKNIPKISLSAKQASEDPWSSIEKKFNPGDKVTGNVTRCMKFGAFVEISPGIEGLVHISEMSYVKRIINTEDVVKPGDSIPVMIKEIDKEGKKISLSIKDAEGDPWVEFTGINSTGSILPGIIEKKEKFGYFITLAPGITGLLPKSRINNSSDSSSIEKLKEGDSITILIEELKPNERKITLAPADSLDGGNWKKFANDSDNSVGSLGEILQNAMNSKKTS
ncbi:MAG: 30S ribosomal protein S1 [Desulfobacteraceae bacterium]|jgi:small subunit ribosomal protein S1|nr:30S ribosomal protein S1 [Desulfobacteraceae bacterium]MBT4363885.1 30S ribosomal protein S1 [Desulfobacteraceae bacterium]